MALAGVQLAVGTSAVRVDSAESDSVSGASVSIVTCDVDLYLGGASVTTGNGAKLPAGTSYSVDLNTGESLYAVAASSGTAHVVRQGV